MSKDELPRIGKPAKRALAELGVTTLTQARAMSEAELLAMHGVGPKAVSILRAALVAQGKDLAPG